ncbi:hypothetical protein ACFE04_022735 [Oxalis oulophora]
MASLPILFSLLLIASSLVYPSKGSVSQNVLTSICTKTIHPPRCIEILKFYPMTPTANVRNMSMISIDIAQMQATLNLHSYERLYTNATEPDMDRTFAICVDYYHKILLHLAIARRKSIQQNYKELKETLSGVRGFTSDCSSVIDISPPPLDEINNAMYFKTQIAIAVTKFLRYY